MPTATIEEYKCKTCKFNKPQIFFGSTNGVMNNICKKCVASCKKQASSIK